MSRSLLDLMTEADRKLALERANKRIRRNKSRKGIDIPPEFYMASELGYYYDWEAIMAFRRGYTIVPKTDEDLEEDKLSGKLPEWTSKYKREMLTTQEAQLLLEGANKVWYKKLIEMAHAGVISNSFNSSSKSFDSAIQPFAEKAKVEE